MLKQVILKYVTIKFYKKKKQTKSHYKRKLFTMNFKEIIEIYKNFELIKEEIIKRFLFVLFYYLFKGVNYNFT